MLDGKEGFLISGRNSNDGLGGGGISTGDVNGDGLADLVIGAPNSDLNSSSSGSAFVIFGTTDNLGSSVTMDTLDGSDGFRLGGQANFDLLGSVGGGGGINGDGFADLMTGSPNCIGFGSVSVIIGGADGFSAPVDQTTLDGNDGFTINGVTSADQPGSEGATSGDFNGDGFDGLLFSARADDSAGYNAAAAYVILGKAGGFAPP